MKIHVKFIALFAAILFAANTSTYARNNNGNDHPAAAGIGGQANGCTNGQATGNKHCTDTTTEVHNEEVQIPPANQIGGNGGSSTPPVESKSPPPVEPKVPVPTGPRGRAEVSRPMPDNPNLTIQRATGDRRQRGGEPVAVVPPHSPAIPPTESKPTPDPIATPTIPGQTPVPTVTPTVPTGPRGRAEVSRPMPDNPNLTIQRATGDRRQREAGLLTPPGTSPDRVGNKTPEGHKLVTRYPGRQPLHDLPRFASENRNQETYCALSGYQRRKFVDVFGQETEAGSLPSLRNGGSIVRDIPAWHEPSPNCLIVIKRRTQE